MSSSRTGEEAATDERQAVYTDLQMVLAGHPLSVALGAVCDSVGTVIAFAADDREGAERLLDNLVVDIKKAMRTNWDYIRSVKASSNNTAGRA
jgi:hypothetical protein